MNKANSILSSKSFYGGLIAVAAGVFGFFDYTLSPDDKIILVETGEALAAALGGALAIWGRLQASKQVQ